MARFGRQSWQVGNVRLPAVVGALIATTLFCSIVGVIGARNGLPLIRLGILQPELVFRGEVWRLVTWVFFELQPISLIFACLMLYWFGRDLAQRWGAMRFLAVWFGFAAGVALATCLIGKFLWSEVYASSYAGSWPMQEALIIAWALLFPDRQIMLYFVLPVGGRALIWITLGGTLLFALYYGFASFLPHFLAELTMLSYVGQLRRWFLKWRLGRLQAQAKRYVANVERADRDEDERGPPSGKPPRWLN
jgi:membrane associated rhomboid family serine protease